MTAGPDHGRGPDQRADAGNRPPVFLLSTVEIILCRGTKENDCHTTIKQIAVVVLEW